MAATSGLSDAALAVFAFAAYHELTSGQRVSQVVRRDRAGHRADDVAVAELAERGLVHADDETIAFTQRGEEALRQAIASLRAAAEGDTVWRA